jgi:hypothetical protein
MKTIMFDLAMPDHFDKLRTGLATSDRITLRSTGRTGKSLTGPRSKGSVV